MKEISLGVLKLKHQKSDISLKLKMNILMLLKNSYIEMELNFRRENATTLNRTHGYDMFCKIMAPRNSTLSILFSCSVSSKILPC